MWFVHVCESIALASRLRGRSVCNAAAVAEAAAPRIARRKVGMRTALSRDLRQMRESVRRIVQPRRRVRLPGRILV